MIGAATAAALLFDLVCTGSEINYTSGTHMTEKPFELRLRLDLAQGKYCSGDCKETETIYHISDTKIVLDNAGTRNESVSRETGHYSMSWLMTATSGLDASGQCTTAPFSGFPTTKF